MIELFILALAYINIIDATVVNGEIQIDGVVTDDQRRTVELWVTYKTMKLNYGYPCESRLGCLGPVEVKKLISSSIPDDDGSFTILHPMQSNSQYSIIVNNQEKRITPINNDSLRTLINSAELDKTEFGLEIARMLGISASKVTVPEWFGNTAGYWSDRDISNAEFLNAVDWLVKKNIIEIS